MLFSKRLLLYLVLLLGIALLGNTIINIIAPKLLLISTNKVSALSLTIWQIQAVFTSIIIAINALTLGFSNIKIYGLNILNFSFTKDKFFGLSQLDIIAIMFLLVFINYFFVAYEALFSVIFLFTITFIGLSIILTKTLILISRPHIIRDKIANYLLYNYEKSLAEKKSSEIISNIYNQNKNAFMNDQIDIIFINNDFLLEISSILSKLYSDKKIDEGLINKQKRKLENVMEYTIKKFFEKNLIVEAMEIANKVIEYTFEENLLVRIDREYFFLLLKEIKQIEKLPNEFQSYLKKSLNLIDENISKNQNVITNREILLYEKSFFSNIISFIYKSIHENEVLSKGEKDAIYLLLRDFIYFSSKQNKYYHLLFLLRETILQKDTKSFKLFIRFYKEDYSIESFKVRLTLTIYLYYLIFKEPLVNGKDFIMFLSFKNFFTFNIYLKRFKVDVYKDLIFHNELTDWEVMVEGEAKIMIIEDAIKEFFILIELNISNSLENLIPNNETFIFINKLNEKNILINNLNKLRSYFDIPNFNDIKITRNINNFKEKLLNNYVDNKILEYKKVNLDKVNNKIKNSNIYFSLNDKEYIYARSLLRYFKTEKDINLESLEHEILCSKNIFTDDWEYIFKFIEDTVFNILNEGIIKKLNNDVLISNWKRTNKLQLLTDSINIEHNTILHNLNMNFLSFFEEDNYKIYQEMTKEFDNIYIEEGIKERFWISGNFNNIKVYLHSIELYVRELKVKEINYLLKQYKTNNNLYQIPIVNDLYVHVNKEKAYSYLFAKNCIVAIKIKFGVQDKNKKKNKLIIFR